MNAIGFRVSPSEVYYSIVQNNEDQYRILSISSLRIPASSEISDKLSHIRKTISTMISEYAISKAGIKRIEGNARSSINDSIILRLYVEGVIIELFTNSTIQNHLLGVTTNIANILDIDKAKPCEMIDSVLDISKNKSDTGRALKNEHKEAILVAIAALEKGD